MENSTTVDYVNSTTATGTVIAGSGVTSSTYLTLGYCSNGCCYGGCTSTEKQAKITIKLTTYTKTTQSSTLKRISDLLQQIANNKNFKIISINTKF
jgi:hypothetical protein